MTVYAVEARDYESSVVVGLYTTQELAESSWDMRNRPSWHEIVEYEVDFDHKANEPDVDDRPRFGPKTHQDQIMSDMYSRMALANLTATTALSQKIGLPLRTGNEVKFFSYTPLKSTSKTV